jgi:hypothetical protein
MAELSETMFSVRSVQSGYEEDNWGRASQLKVESQPVERRLRGLCEMAVSLIVESAIELRKEN